MAKMIVLYRNIERTYQLDMSSFFALYVWKGMGDGSVIVYLSYIYSIFILYLSYIYPML